MQWHRHTAIVFYSGGEVEDDLADFSSFFEPAATASAPNPSDEPGEGDDAYSTLRDEMHSSL
jgi:hypothetical protein